MGAGRGRRTGLIVVVLILLLLVGGGALILWLGQQAQPQNTGEPTPTEVPQTTNVIVAARAISRGTRMSASDVTSVEWPLSVALPAGSLIQGDGVTTAGLEQVEGRVARVDILQGQQVLDSMLTVADQNLTLQQSGSDAALLVPAGQVAVAMEINRVSSVAYAIRPGDHVDIMISYRFVDVDEEWQTYLPNALGLLVLPSTVTPGTVPEIFGRVPTEQPFGFQWMVVPNEDSPRPRQATQLIIDNAVVMHTGDWPLTDEAVVVATQAPPADGAEAAPPPTAESAGAGATAAPPAVPTIVTLVMSRQDALVLKFSFEQGADIDFALRSALDNAVTDVTTETVSLQYLLDFYNLADPPRLPIALDPRTDTFVDKPSGEFPINFGPGLFSFLTPAP